MNTSRCLAMDLWQSEITVRGLLVSAALGTIFCLITLKLSLTVGIIPSLNVAAGLLGFFFLKSWTEIANKLGFCSRPFTRQENTVVQTCVVACYGIAAYGGFGSWMLGMSKKIYSITKAGAADDVKELSLGWIFGFLFACSFIGLMALVPLRKVMILDYKLTFPSGTATAMLINSFHTFSGEEIAKNRVSCLGKFFTGSFLWSGFKWFFSGDGSCGFDHFPSLGLKAYTNTFYFDFSATYVGVGLLCPHIVNFSVLLGAILSWGMLWPFISAQSGYWFPTGLDKNDFRGLNAYKVFLGTSLVLGDGLYNLVKIAWVSITRYRKKDTEESIALLSNSEENEIFLKQGVSLRIAAAGYVILTAISVVIIPLLISQFKWYYVLLCCILTPALSFCNAYASGLTDFSMSNTYAKLGLFIFSSWSGDHGGVINGLVAYGLMTIIISTASDLMQDIKTGYLTLSSPRSMFISQVVGTALGCIIAPLWFWLYWTAFDIGNPEGEYKAPSAVLFREMAAVGEAGLSALPRYCVQLCVGHLVFAIVLNFARDFAPPWVSKFVPMPVAMGIPYYVGAFFAVDMFVGSLVLFAWQRMRRDEARELAPVVAAGLICGEGIWTLPDAMLALVGVKPPICMTFRPT